MLTAAEAAAADCLAMLAEDTMRGSPGWLECVAKNEAVKAAEDKLAQAFIRGLCTV